MTYGVQEGAALDLGGTATGVVDVVALQGDVVVGTVKVDTPVVVAVAGSGVAGGTVDVAVGDGHALGGIGTQDNVLTANASSGNVVNPDHVAVVDGDGITTPDVLGVDVGDGDIPGKASVSKRFTFAEPGGKYILDDNVAGTADDTQTLTLDNTGGTLTDDGLVGGNGDTENTGVVTCRLSVYAIRFLVTWLFHLLGDRDGRSAGLVVLAPGVLVNSNLASRRGTPGSAASAGGGTLGATEVKGLAQDNDASLTITKVRDQLAGGRRVDGSSGATTSNALRETLGGAGDADSSSVGSESCEQGSILHDDNEGPRKKDEKSE